MLFLTKKTLAMTRIVNSVIVLLYRGILKYDSTAGSKSVQFHIWKKLSSGVLVKVTLTDNELKILWSHFILLKQYSSIIYDTTTTGNKSHMTVNRECKSEDCAWNTSSLAVLYLLSPDAVFICQQAYDCEQKDLNECFAPFLFHFSPEKRLVLWHSLVSIVYSLLQ